MAIPLPPPPLRSALKHSNSPSAATSPASSPFVSTHGLPAVSSSPTDESFSLLSSPPLPSSTSSSSRPSTASTSYSPIAATTSETTTSSSLLNRTSSSASVTSGTTTGTTTVQNNNNNPLSAYAYASMPQTPVPGYTPKVSFDTFENPAASMFSFTLSSKSDGYKRTRNTRVFLCASSPDESGREALDWALESFVQDGDEFVVFRGVEEDVLDTRLVFPPPPGPSFPVLPS
ncbi:hypothetical protein K435DRAFT_875682 [Dendrothele bispora CBS 962.96]|uniref:Uncharacterized protein n=1 Tax=Dendrothele bispora (strain CBS 962.96) TaxID=1314807 RepID=A0A4S8KU18_DENBC|nr:hypothetical protein K435DRAFT_875682 [Dendrothele bispora CBS 962.96]